jgi:hypothetical protein
MEFEFHDWRRLLDPDAIPNGDRYTIAHDSANSERFADSCNHGYANADHNSDCHAYSSAEHSHPDSDTITEPDCNRRTLWNTSHDAHSNLHARAHSYSRAGSAGR